MIIQVILSNHEEILCQTNNHGELFLFFVDFFFPMYCMCIIHCIFVSLFCFVFFLIDRIKRCGNGENEYTK